MNKFKLSLLKIRAYLGYAITPEYAKLISDSGKVKEEKRLKKQDKDQTIRAKRLLLELIGKACLKGRSRLEINFENLLSGNSLPYFDSILDMIKAKEIKPWAIVHAAGLLIDDGWDVHIDRSYIIIVW